MSRQNLDVCPNVRPVVLPLAAALLLALTACGGGGGSDDSADDSLSSETATHYAADSTLVASDTTVAVETAVVTAEAVTATQAGGSAASTGRSSAQAAGQGEGQASAQAVASVPVACPGGGSATLTITGGTALSVLNGQFDAGEMYAITFDQCAAASGAAQVNGAMTLTVQSAGSGSLVAAVTATALQVGLPRGRLSYSGAASWSASRSDNGGGVTVANSTLAADQLSVTTAYAARSSQFALTAVDVQRSATWSGELLQSSSMSGSWTLSASGVNGNFSATVATQRNCSFDAEGNPTGGGWSLDLPTARLTMSVAGGSATLQLDSGKDGSIDRSWTATLPELEAAAG